MVSNNTFLTAKWENLVLINYEINPEILLPYVPIGTKIDLFHNKCYVSLVGFMFKNTKVLGIKAPFHVNFEEVNLRFYLKYQEKRGVVFIKEIVPKPLITYVANTLYKEHYETCKMFNKHQVNQDSRLLQYGWVKNEKTQTIGVTAAIEPIEIDPNSTEEFITEHYFGYTKNKDKTFEYEVQHPRWQHYPVKEYTLNVDFELNYGKDFGFLNHCKPSSIILAKGSEISVMNKKTIAY